MECDFISNSMCMEISSSNISLDGFQNDFGQAMTSVIPAFPPFQRRASIAVTLCLVLHPMVGVWEGDRELVSRLSYHRGTVLKEPYLRDYTYEATLGPDLEDKILDFELIMC